MTSTCSPIRRPADCDAAVERLLDYYLHTALAADRHIPPGTPPTTSGRLFAVPPNPDLSTLAQSAAWPTVGYGLGEAPARVPVQLSEE